MTFEKMQGSMECWAPILGYRPVKGKWGQGIMMDTAQNTPGHVPVIKEGLWILKWGTQKRIRVLQTTILTQKHLDGLQNSFAFIGSFIITTPSPVL